MLFSVRLPQQHLHQEDDSHRGQQQLEAVLFRPLPLSSLRIEQYEQFDSLHPADPPLRARHHCPKHRLFCVPPLLDTDDVGGIVRVFDRHCDNPTDQADLAADAQHLRDGEGVHSNHSGHCVHARVGHAKVRDWDVLCAAGHVHVLGGAKSRDERGQEAVAEAGACEE